MTTEHDKVASHTTGEKMASSGLDLHSHLEKVGLDSNLWVQPEMNAIWVRNLHSAFAPNRLFGFQNGRELKTDPSSIPANSGPVSSLVILHDQHDGTGNTGKHVLQIHRDYYLLSDKRSAS